jgi:hypothetical protein
MPTALDLAANLTGAAVTEGQEKTWFTAMRAALAEMGDPMGRPGAIQNLSLVFSVASNALTCNVKTRAGAAPSATDPASVALRNATLATGDFHILDIVAALSFTISSGSTFGHTSAAASDIFWYIIDNAGAAELAASTKYYGQQGIVSTTAEGGAGAADSATVMYSTTARSNVAFRCIGHTIDTQTTAGTWTAVPTTSELAPFDASPIGIGVPVVKYKTSNQSVTSSTTLVDVTDLAFTIGANEKWVVDFTLFTPFANGGGGFSFALTNPSGATPRNVGGAIYKDAAVSSVGPAVSTNGYVSGTSFLGATPAGADNSAWAFLHAYIANGSTPGTVQLQFAQNASNGISSTILEGSKLVAYRVA